MSVRLRYLAEVNPPTPEFERLLPEDEVTFLPLESVWRDEGVALSQTRTKEEVSSGYTRFRNGDIIIPKITPTFQADRSTIIDGLRHGVGAGTTELHVVRPRADLEPRFARYILSSKPFLDGGKASMIGVAGQKRVPESWIRDYEVPVTDVRAQRAIANFLDRETRRIDALISKKDRLTQLLHEAVNVWFEVELRQLAEEEIPLRRLLLEPPTYGAAESAEAGDPSWPRYIRITDLTPDGNLRSDDIRRLHPDIARPFLLRDEDLLFARSGTIGKAFRYRVEMAASCFAGYLIRFRFDRSRVLPGIIEAWARTTHYWSQIGGVSLQVTIENVSAQRYKELLVPVPSVRAQAKLLRELEARRATTGALQERLRSQRDALRERRQALITAAVTGHMEIPSAA